MPTARRAGPGLGTFSGVFTPSVLTILGLILFLRMGFVVGNAGLGRALLILAMANVISVLTSLSLATIATNLRVRAGGDYYLISRTLGVEFGGALGIVLFLAQSVSIAFYAIGFGEAFASILGATGAGFPQLVAAAAVAALFVLAWLGADVATKFQFVVMAVLGAAIAAFFVGGIGAFDGETLRENWSPSGNLPFWAIFALFFPAVTGFTQGVSMSGDLKDPARSLPRGTFLAVGISALIYVGVAVVFAGAMPGSRLVSDYGAMRSVSAVSWLIDAGVVAATLSSALASFLGAPRILQSLARDRVFPWLGPFGKGSGPAENPRRGVLLAAGIAFAVIALGDLNVVAPIVSMFFLISYGLLNYATWFESRAESPSFRPTFRWHRPWVSLAGAAACLGAMVAIDLVAALVALSVLVAIHQYLARTVSLRRWSDSARSHRLRRVREDLLSVSSEPEHPRDWRPVILAFSDDPERRQRLLRFAGWIEGRSGFTTAVRVLPGVTGAGAARLRREGEAELSADLVRGGGQAFGRVVTAPDLESALPVLLQAHGLGAIRANTMLLNWVHPEPGGDAAGLDLYGCYLRMALRQGLHVVVLEARAEALRWIDEADPEARLIDVWHLDDATGSLALLLAYLMTRREEWEQASIRVFAPVPESGEEAGREDLERRLAEARIPGEVHLVPRADAKAVIRHSGEAAVVFLPVRLRGKSLESAVGGSLEELKEALRVTALVLSARGVDLDAAPEDGALGEIARATDVATEAEAKARHAEQDAERAREEAERVRARAEAEAAAAGEGTAAAPEADRAERKAERARRKAAKARAKARAAEREAQELAGEPPPEGEPEPPAG